MDNYLRSVLKKSSQYPAPPKDGKMRLLKAASEPASPGWIKRVLRLLFPGTHPLEKVSAPQVASVVFFESTMIWAFRSGTVNLRFFF
jgi:hypothetical protein